MVYFGFAIQILGISLTDKNLEPLIKPTPLLLRLLGDVGVGISMLAPLLALVAMAKIGPVIKNAATPAKKALIWVIVILAVVISLMECLWSCSGHPTWYQGFAG